MPLTTTYQRFQAPRQLDTGLLQRVLGGLATRDYARCAEAVPEAFGLSASSVSRRFIRASARQLQTLLERRLDAETFLAVVIDGKTFAEDGMVTAVGVTVDGRKVILGFVQTATENRRVCAAFLRALVERALGFEDGPLVVTDGAKGLHAAVEEVFGAAAVLQRCQWHKRENVVSYLPEKHRPAIRRNLQAAYERPTYHAAAQALKQIRQELRVLNASALTSLEEGLEETLTLHRLGVFRELGISLKIGRPTKPVVVTDDERRALIRVTTRARVYFASVRLELIDAHLQQLDEELAALLRGHQDAVQRLAAVPGLGVDSAQQIIAEVGPTATTFPTAKHLASWVGACPGHDESAGVNHSRRSPSGTVRCVACSIKPPTLR